VNVSAQTTVDAYYDFDLARTNGNTEAVIQIGEKILPKSSELPAKSQVYFFYKLASAYEGNAQPEKALPLYEKVFAAVPDYYVVNLALGNIYLKQGNVLVPQINNSKGDPKKYESLMNQYRALVKKALPHLERSMACDPNEQQLQQITALYKQLKDPAINSLQSRLDAYKGKCIDLITD